MVHRELKSEDLWAVGVIACINEDYSGCLGIIRAAEEFYKDPSKAIELYTDSENLGGAARFVAFDLERRLRSLGFDPEIDLPLQKVNSNKLDGFFEIQKILSRLWSYPLIRDSAGEYRNLLRRFSRLKDPNLLAVIEFVEIIGRPLMVYLSETLPARDNNVSVAA